LRQSDNREDELLASRLLFLCTYGTKLDFTELFNKNDLADGISIVGSRPKVRNAVMAHSPLRISPGTQGTSRMPPKGNPFPALMY
jgi:hypothetical protein